MASSLIACHCCDLLNHLADLKVGCTACCSRCGAVLYHRKKDSINRTLALTVTALILYLIANTHPFLGFKIGPQIQETTLITGVYELYSQGMLILASLVLFTVIAAPSIQLLCLLYILIPFVGNRRAILAAPVFRLFHQLQLWKMTEIFMLGILVSMIKLLKMATIIPGIASFAFLAFIFFSAAISVQLDSHLVWEKIDTQ